MTEPAQPQPEAPPAPVASAQTPETDWQAEARKWEKRSKDNYDRVQELQPLADQFRQLEEASKSDMQRLQESLEAANRAREETAAEALRMKVAMSHGLSADDLELLGTGSEDQLTARAQRIAQLAAAAAQAAATPTPPPGGRTVPDLRPGAVPSDPPTSLSAVEARHRQFFAARYEQSNQQ